MKRTYLNISIFFVLLIVFGYLYSCKKDNYNEAQELEDKYLSDFALANPSYTKTDLGYYVKNLVPGTGIIPKEGDYVMIEYSIRFLKNNRLFDTTDTISSQDNYIKSTYSYFNGPIKTQIFVDRGFYSTGICKALLTMKEGQTDSLVIPGKLSNISEYNPVKVYLKLNKVITNNKQFELAQIEKYFMANNFGITIADSTGKGGNASWDSTGLSNGIYFLSKDTTGIGSFIDEKDSVTLKYKFSLMPYKDTYLDIKSILVQKDSLTTIIDSTDYFISGFRGALRLLKNKSKATILIPYHKGYGSVYQPVDPDDPSTASDPIDLRVLIPSYSTLIYEIEITSVTKK